ncbi:MAG: hypothetical protein WC654_08110, partial [Patescibacteria group bacterium]
IKRIKDELGKLIQNQQLEWVKRGDNHFTCFSFHAERPIGRDSIVPLMELSQDTKVIREPRGALEGDKSNIINKAIGFEAPSTNTITVEILKEPKQTHLTAYPGSIGPDFPDKTQSPEEQQYNQQFWDSVAFCD